MKNWNSFKLFFVVMVASLTLSSNLQAQGKNFDTNQIPDEVWINNIFPHLKVKDIPAVMKTNRHFQGLVTNLMADELAVLKENKGVIDPLKVGNKVTFALPKSYDKGQSGLEYDDDIDFEAGVGEIIKINPKEGQMEIALRVPLPANVPLPHKVFLENKLVLDLNSIKADRKNKLYQVKNPEITGEKMVIQVIQQDPKNPGKTFETFRPMTKGEAKEVSNFMAKNGEDFENEEEEVFEGDEDEVFDADENSDDCTLFQSPFPTDPEMRPFPEVYGLAKIDLNSKICRVSKYCRKIAAADKKKHKEKKEKKEKMKSSK